MKVGVIYTAFNAEPYLHRSLPPWMDARTDKLGGHDYLIAAVNYPFIGFDTSGPRDFTDRILTEYLQHGRIDHLCAGADPVTEVVARGRALDDLVDQQCDITVMVDADEIWTEKDILGVMAWVEANPHAVWHRVSLVNLVFDTNTRLVDPFTPPRVHRVRAGAYRAHSFYDDNNVTYGGTITRDLIRDVEFPSLTIPESVAAPLHFTWLNDERSRRKCEYQAKRGWMCSYRWDAARGLCFNESFYLSHGQPIPEVRRLGT